MVRFLFLLQFPINMDWLLGVVYVWSNYLDNSLSNGEKTMFLEFRKFKSSNLKHRRKFNENRRND